MTLSWDDAVAQVTAPGTDFEVAEAVIDGRTYEVFRGLPPSLRTLFERARAFGDKEYIYYEGERWTFAKLMRHVDALGALLVERYGVRPGDRVAIALRNCPEWVVAFGASVSVGAVVVPLNSWWQTDELAYGLQDSGPRVLIADSARLERLAAAPPPADGRGLQILAVHADTDGFAGAEHYEDVLPLGASLPDVAIDPEDDATILYTSGTTGHPKGSVSCHRAVLSALWSFACRAAIETARAGGVPAVDPDLACLLLPVPLFHVTGCVAIMLSTVRSGTRIVMMPRWNPEHALELIEHERVTQVVGVPTMSWDLLESPDFAERDTSSLVSVGGGGAPAPPELVRRVENSFAQGHPTIGYGMTETNAYGPQNRGADYLARPTSTGRVVPTAKMRVADAEGNVLPPGEAGELWFWGPNLFRGYWNRPEDTAETLVDGWLRSGDIGRIDEDGFVYVEDRLKDMVLRGGENIYCAEVEAAIYEHPAVYEAAVFGLPHERLGEEVACAVHLKSGATLDAAELHADLKGRIAAFKVPTVVEFYAEQLPRTASGKIMKRQLRDDFIARTAQGTSTADTT